MWWSSPGPPCSRRTEYPSAGPTSTTNSSVSPMPTSRPRAALLILGRRGTPSVAAGQRHAGFLDPVGPVHAHQDGGEPLHDASHGQRTRVHPAEVVDLLGKAPDGR